MSTSSRATDTAAAARIWKGIEQLGLLAEPTRRRLYEYVIAQPDAVGRDEAGAAMGIKRPLTAFHLDRLAAGGLLEVEYRHLTGRRGPGAGRPAKLYRKTSGEVGASAPPRDYGLAAEVFADALAAAGVQAELLDAARRRGREIGRRLSRCGAGSVADLMAAAGYAPVREDDGTTRALNCPFRRLARRQLEVTCAMNVSLLDAAFRAAGVPSRTQLDPRPGYCCVAVQPSP